MPVIKLPHIYKARDYQLDFWDAYHGVGAHQGKNYRIFVKVWHRRGGKDMTDWNAAIERTAENPGNCRYVFPTNDMARANLWEASINEGVPFTDFVPMELRVRANSKDNGLNDTLKRIQFVNGGAIRVVSGHRPNTLRGGNDHTFVLSEFQAQDPQIIDIIMPILRLNGGKLLINMTANGDSPAKVMLEHWKTQPDVYVSELSIEDTQLLDKEEMDSIFGETIAGFRSRGQGEEEAIAFVRQEYYCDWSAPVIGSYFGAAMKHAEEEHRITRVPMEPTLPVHTAWDLGVDDSTSIWFFQVHNREVRLIDYYESSGEGFAHYARVLNGQESGFERMGRYTYGQHFGPHDIKVRNLGVDAKTRLEIAKSLGIDFTVVKRVNAKEEGIEAIRQTIPRCWFNEDTTVRGRSALKGYRKEFNEQLQVYKDKPVHDWTSHGTDGFQTMALALPMLGNDRGGGKIIKTGSKYAGGTNIPSVSPTHGYPRNKAGLIMLPTTERGKLILTLDQRALYDSRYRRKD
jgi:phage terminase large subunit